MIVGLDISKATMDACIVTAKGRLQRQFANSPRGVDQLYDWMLAKCPTAQPAASDALVVMEATGTYHTLPAFILHGLGVRVAVANPYRARKFADAFGFLSKTDKADAHSLAMLGERADPQTWVPPPDAMLELRELVARLVAVTKHIQAEKQRLEERPRYVAWLGVASSLMRSIEWHQAEKEALQDFIEEFYEVPQHSTLQADRKLLQTIPGVGPFAADHLLCLLRVRKLNSAREAAAMAGVVPVHRQSGTSVNGRSHISHEGDARVRAGLFMPTRSACQHDPVMKARYEALQARGLSKLASQIACTARLIRVSYGVITHQTPYNADHGQARSAA